MGQAQKIVRRADGDEVYKLQPDGTYALSDVRDTFQALVKGSDTYTDQGAGPDNHSSAMYVDLTDYSECKLALNVPVAGVTSVIKLGFDTSLEACVNTISLASTGDKSSAWEAIPAGSRGIMQLALITSGGNGAEDPQISGAIAHFRR